MFTRIDILESYPTLSFFRKASFLQRILFSQNLLLFTMKIQYLLFGAFAALLLQSCGPTKSLSRSDRPDSDKVTYASEAPEEDARGGAVDNYIARYADIAVREMRRTGVPASIKLAQGLLESGAGQSQLARESNNHFGIKCGSNWTGQVYEHYDDDRDKDGNIIKSCFRVYNDPEQGFMDHSDFLRDPRKEFRYGKLFQLDPTDYRAWARGLREAGYATDPNYPQKLINLIESQQLYQYDQYLSIVEPPSPNTSMEIVLFNNYQAVVARGGETIRSIAQATGVQLDGIYRANGGRYNFDQQLQAGTPVYLQELAGSVPSIEPKLPDPTPGYHYVSAGDTLYSIAKKYNLTVQALKLMNNLQIDLIDVGVRLRVK